MAVEPSKQRPQLVKDFWPKFKRSSVVIIIVLQLLILIALAILLNSFGFFKDNPIGVAGTLVANAILGIVASVVIYHIIAKPIKHLLAVLVHISGEPTNITPPNPNEERFQKNGFRPVLQTLYQLAADTPDPIAEGDSTQTTGITQNAAHFESSRTAIEAALDSTVCGFVALNRNRQITYANKATPLRVDTNGARSLELIFNDNDTIDLWWDECEKNAVYAEKKWSRIPNKLTNEEDRRFFDVIASYHKGTENEVVLTLVDRTYLYEVSEDELDFIAFATHELRGPITVIRGYLDVLQGELDDVLQEDQKELFRRLVVSSSRLTGYINNILNTSRYDRRHLKMHLSETTVQRIYETIRDDMDLRASAQNRLLSVSIPADLPTIAADSVSLGEVFTNLIDNAVSYTHLTLPTKRIV